MTYAEAILAMNEGKRVRRHCWESDASIFMSKDNKFFIERQVSRKYKEDFGWRVFIANNYSDYTEVDV